MWSSTSSGLSNPGQPINMTAKNGNTGDRIPWLGWDLLGILSDWNRVFCLASGSSISNLPFPKASTCQRKHHQQHYPCGYRPIQAYIQAQKEIERETRWPDPDSLESPANSHGFTSYGHHTENGLGSAETAITIQVMPCDIATIRDAWLVTSCHKPRQARAGYDRRQATTLRPCSGNYVLTWNDTNTMTHWWCTVCSAKRWCILRGGNDVREIWIFLMYHVLHDVCNTMQLWQNLPGETGLPVLHPGHCGITVEGPTESTIPPNQHKSLWSSDPYAELCKTVHHHIGSVFFPVPDLSQLVDVGSLHFTLLCCASTQHLFGAGLLLLNYIQFARFRSCPEMSRSKISIVSASLHTLSDFFLGIIPPNFQTCQPWVDKGGWTKTKGHIGELSLETCREVESLRMSPEPFLRQWSETAAVRRETGRAVKRIGAEHVRLKRARKLDKIKYKYRNI